MKTQWKNDTMGKVLGVLMKIWTQTLRIKEFCVLWKLSHCGFPSLQVHLAPDFINLYTCKMLLRACSRQCWCIPDKAESGVEAALQPLGTASPAASQSGIPDPLNSSPGII